MNWSVDRWEQMAVTYSTVNMNWSVDRWEQISRCH
jgi:hypothetical protein